MTDDNRGYFSTLDSIRPNYISFSQFLGLAAHEYYDHHKEGVSKITDFTNSDVTPIPHYYAETDIWKTFILNMPSKDIKKFQKRLNQLTNLSNKRVQEMIA